MDTTHWNALLDRIYSEHRFIVIATALAPANHVAELLESHGAKTLCVVASRGTNAPPEEEMSHAPVVVDELIDYPAPPQHDTMSSVRHALDVLSRLPEEAIGVLDAFDPDGTACSVGPIFDDGADFYGRRKFGARSAECMALEDKTIIDALWDEIGIPRSPHRVVDFEFEALFAAHQQLDRGAGSVIAVDNGNGFHGGASGTQWIQERAHIEECLEHFAHDNITHARVMPFLEGIPCSIHGIVLPDHVITLRPCEMLIFRSPGEKRFYYAGSATYWTPSDDVRDTMRELASTIGEHLRAHVGYRGAFTVDGVLTLDGFRPTELNPRFGAALGYVGAGTPELALLLLNLAIVEGVAADWQGHELEAILREGASKTRRGSLSINVPTRPIQSWAMPLHRDEQGTYRIAAHEQEVHARLSFGPIGSGGYLRISPTKEHLPGSEPFAPRALELLGFAGKVFELGLDVTKLESARAV